MATDQNGRTIIFEPSPAGLKRIALNELDDKCNATPAVADDSLFIRSSKYLYCISER